MLVLIHKRLSVVVILQGGEVMRMGLTLLGHQHRLARHPEVTEILKVT